MRQEVLNVSQRSQKLTRKEKALPFCAPIPVHLLWKEPNREQLESKEQLAESQPDGHIQDTQPEQQAYSSACY